MSVADAGPRIAFARVLRAVEGSDPSGSIPPQYLISRSSDRFAATRVHRGVNTIMRFEQEGRRYALTAAAAGLDELGSGCHRLGLDEAEAVLRWMTQDARERAARWLRARSEARRPRWGADRGPARGALTHALWRGQLVLWDVSRSRPAVSGSLDDRAFERYDEDGEPLITSTWVEIEVVDDDGEPLRDLAYELVLPDGSRRMGVLDAEARARVTGISDGTCEVDFPDLVADEWRAA